MDRKVNMPFDTVELRTLSDGPGIPSSGSPAAVDPREEIEHHLAEMRAFAFVLARKRALADRIVTRGVVAAWTNIHEFERGSNMRAWLFRLLRTIHYAERGALEGRAAKVVDFLKVRDERIRTNEEARFRQAFDALPDEQREAMVLVGPMRFSVAEAAAIIGCSTTTIRNRARLGRLRLAAIVSLDSQATG
jgi:RNA polymerase sigma-70 factor (ECF subfamily)